LNVLRRQQNRELAARRQQQASNTAPVAPTDPGNATGPVMAGL
jgi:hypothetical protein